MPTGTVKTRLAIALAVLLGLCALVLWRLRSPQEEGEPGAVEPAAVAGNGAAGAGTRGKGDADPAPRNPDPRPPKWRGLRLLETGTVPEDAAAPPHPWAEYLKFREATLRRWDETLMSLDLEGQVVTELPGVFGTACGLVLRLDPACAPSWPTVTMRTHDLDARSTLSLIVRMLGLRMTVGLDGLMWLVPEEGRAECEPEFIQDLRRWEAGVERESRSANDEKVLAAATVAAMRDRKARVELVGVTLKEALASLEKTFGIPLKDRRGGDPPPGERVTIVQESVTLEEALREILGPLDMGPFVDGREIEIHNRKDLEEWIESDEYEEANRKKNDAAKGELLSRKVTLNGSPLSAEDLAAETARQVGIPVVIDPRLRSSHARWEAVEAELTAGEVLKAIEQGAGCSCRLRDSHWPEYDMGDGWTLWIFWTAPDSGKTTPR